MTLHCVLEHGELNGFQDIKSLMRFTRWGLPMDAGDDFSLLLSNVSDHETP